MEASPTLNEQTNAHPFSQVFLFVETFRSSYKLVRSWGSQSRMYSLRTFFDAECEHCNCTTSLFCVASTHRHHRTAVFLSNTSKKYHTLPNQHCQRAVCLRYEHPNTIHFELLWWSRLVIAERKVGSRSMTGVKENA